MIEGKFRPMFLWDSKEITIKGRGAVISMSAGKLTLKELEETIELIKGKGKEVILKQDKEFKNSFRLLDKETGILLGSFRRRIDALDVCSRHEWKAEDLTKKEGAKCEKQ